MATMASEQITLQIISDIKKVIRYYLLQDASLVKPNAPTTYPPDSKWSSEILEDDSGGDLALYFVDCTLLSNGEFAYSEVSMSGSYELAKAAHTKASEAKNLAGQATTSANNAVEIANTAKNAADTAQTSASSAMTKAEEASTLAGEVKMMAQSTSTIVEEIKQDAANTQKEIESLNANLETLSNTMTTEYVKNTELTETTATLQTQISQNASSISATALQLQTLDETVSSVANEAKELAETASSTANSALTKANQATTDATTAKTNAETAVSAAATAQSKADSAATQVEEANKKVTQAQEDLATAKQNLEAVTNRVGATEEEIAQAQADVATAQAAADQAQSDATAAQSAATVAQTAADNAKAAADQAQADATAAQSAADKAQDDVNSLAVRVSKTETDITANAEKIALSATKDEVAQTLLGYYTKTEADANLTVKANEITSTVDSKINKIKVGGRNLLYDSRFDIVSDKWEHYPNYSGEYEVVELDGKICGHATGSLNVSKSIFQSMLGKVEPNQEYTFSGWVKVSNIVPGTSTFGLQLYQEGTYYNDNGELMHFFYPSENIPYDTDEWQYLSKTFTTTDIISIAVSYKFYILLQDFTGDIYFRNLKFEKGNKATDWSPAPEDVDADINGIDSSLRNTIQEQSTSLTQNAESIVAQALSEYSETGELAKIKNELQAQLDFQAKNLTATFTEVQKSVDNVESKLQEQLNTITKYFTFDINGMTIGQIDNPYKVVIDNDSYTMLVNEVPIMTIENGKVHTQELEITDGFNLFGYSFSQDNAGNVNFEYVGGET